MHAMIRSDDGAVAATETLLRAERALAAAMSHVPGFVSHATFATEEGTLVSVSICEDMAGLEAIGSLLEDWLSAHVPETQQPAVMAGEIIMQRGL